MIQIESLTVNKAKVYNEVAMTTEYAGAKNAEDDNAYLRIMVTDDDRLKLERFWGEACNTATEIFRPFLLKVKSQPIGNGVDLDCNYEVELRMPEGYESSLTAVIESQLYSLFVDIIAAKWFRFSNKQDADVYAAEAAGIMDGIRRDLYHRKKPIREAFNL